MFKRIALCIGCGLTLMGGCPPMTPGDSDGNADDLFQARRWSQLQSDEEGTGFNAAHTTYALPPFVAWSVDVGPLAFSSPVIGPDDTIYVGNLAGELVALRPDGTQRWRRPFAPQRILSTPAVAPNGDIFVITATQTDGGELACKLNKLDSGAGLHAVSTYPFSTTASPKYWNGYVFVSTDNGQLLVFNADGLSLHSRTDGNCGPICGESLFSDILEAIFVHVLPCIFTFGQFNFTDEDCYGFSVSAGGAAQTPSVAIVDQPGLIDDPSRPIVILASSSCATAYRFNPDGANDPQRLAALWGQLLYGGDCDDELIRPTSPAVLSGGQVIVGDNVGYVRSFDLLTGALNWDHHDQYSISAPPVAFLRQIYVMAGQELVVLDSDGDEMSRVPLRGYGGGAAMSLDFVYVATSAGIHSFSLLPTTGYTFDGSIASGGYSATTPAIGADGTVYVSTAGGRLIAYRNLTTTTLAFRVPALTWDTPIEGDEVSYAAGLALRIAVSPAAAENVTRVVIDSTVDGELCEMEVDATSDDELMVMCPTAKPLTLGDHVLRAFAIDADGGTQSATVSIRVVNTPPVVEILKPVDSLDVTSETPVSMQAAVTDIDEDAFPAERIVWSSDRDGELGAGEEITRKLSVGLHEITVTATDELGAATSASVTVSVETPNTPPTVEIDEPMDGATLFSAIPIRFEATVTDPDESDFLAERIVWTSNLDGEIGSGAVINPSLTTGTHTITVTATDADGASAARSITIVTIPQIQ